MNKLNIIVIGILCLIGAALPVQAQNSIAIVVPIEEQGYKIDPDKDINLVGKDYPYWIFDDKGVVRYCMEPEYYGQVTTPCWSYGVSTDCTILPKEDGYIDCDVKENESSN